MDLEIDDFLELMADELQLHQVADLVLDLNEDFRMHVLFLLALF